MSIDANRTMFKRNLDFNLDLLKINSPPLIGVDIGTSSIKMVELSKTDKKKAGYCVERYVIEPLQANVMQEGGIVNLDAVSEALERSWKRLGSKVKNIALALPASDVITKKIFVPAGQREEDLEFQVENEASQYIPFALDEVNIDFQILRSLPNNSDEVEVLIVASRRDKVEDRIAAALSAGLKTIVMDVEPYAVQTVFELVKNQLPECGEDQVIAMVDIGATIMKFNVLHKGKSVYLRDQSFGGNQLTQDIRSQFKLSLHDSEKMKRSGELPENYKIDVLQPFCETLALEVMRAIQFFYTSTQYSQINYILIAGGCAVIPGLDEIISSRTHVSTLVVNPFSSMELSSRIIPRQINAHAPSLLIACGLAMRSFDTA